MSPKSTKVEADPPHGALLDVPVFTLGRLGRFARSAVHVAFAEAGAPGLSARTYFALRCLHEDGQMSQRELADQVSMDRSDLVKVLDELEDAGHLRRNPDPSDRRRHLLSITPRGVKMVEQGRRALDRATEIVFAGLDPDEQAALHDLGRRVLLNAVEV